MEKENEIEKQPKKKEEKKNVYRSIHYKYKIDTKEQEEIIPKAQEKKTFLESTSSYRVRNQTFKKSDSLKDTQTKQIPVERERHLTRKVETRRKIGLEPEPQKNFYNNYNYKNNQNETQKYNTRKEIIKRVNEEGTFKNSIRNKYKRINREKNS